MPSCITLLLLAADGRAGPLFVVETADVAEDEVAETAECAVVVDDALMELVARVCDNGGENEGIF